MSNVHKLAASYLRRLAADRMPVTIYLKSALGVSQLEGYLTEVHSPGGVSYVPKRGRKERMIMTYYSPFIMVVKGWGHPDPDSPWQHVSENEETVVQKGRYRSVDPRWVEDFLLGPGKALKPIVLFEKGRLVLNKSGL